MNAQERLDAARVAVQVERQKLRSAVNNGKSDRAIRRAAQCYVDALDEFDDASTEFIRTTQPN